MSFTDNEFKFITQYGPRTPKMLDKLVDHVVEHDKNVDTEDFTQKLHGRILADNMGKHLSPGHVHKLVDSASEESFIPDYIRSIDHNVPDDIMKHMIDTHPYDVSHGFHTQLKKMKPEHLKMLVDKTGHVPYNEFDKSKDLSPEHFDVIADHPSFGLMTYHSFIDNNARPEHVKKYLESIPLKNIGYNMSALIRHSTHIKPHHVDSMIDRISKSDDEDTQNNFAFNLSILHPADSDRAIRPEHFDKMLTSFKHLGNDERKRLGDAKTLHQDFANMMAQYEPKSK